MSDPTKRPLRVFLCHASVDKPAVRKLYNYLKQHGVHPWLDEIDLLPGQNWRERIPEALNSSDVIVVCLSKNSVDKEGYVQKEIRFALDKAEEMPEGTIFIIPARLEECNVPPSLSRYHWVDLFLDNGYKKLIQSLNVRAAKIGPNIAQGLVTDQSQPGISRSSKMIIPLIGCACLLIAAITASIAAISGFPGIFKTSTPTQTATSSASLIESATEPVPTLTRTPFELEVGEVDLSSESLLAYTVSPNSQRFAYVIKAGNSLTVFVNHSAYGTYEDVLKDFLVFSPDSQHVAYPAKQNGEWFMALDGKLSEKSYDGIGDDHSIFSPDSQRVAYAAVEGGKWFVIVDDQQWGDPYDKVGYVIFSADSQHVAYWATKSTKTFVIVNGQQIEESYDRVGSVVFGPDSLHIAYTAKINDEWFMLLDGKKEGPYDDVGVEALVFSPDSQRVANAVVENDEWFMVVDGKKEGPYHGFNKYWLVFSPDSRRTFYTVLDEDGKAFAVVDSQAETARYDGIGLPIFSQDSKHLAYGVQRNGETFMIVDGKAEGPYEALKSEPIFSQDSNHWAYGAKQDGKWFVVEDGKASEVSYKDLGDIIFSPDSKRLAYWAIQGIKSFIVVDGVEQQAYEAIGINYPVFSPDSKHVIYRAKQGGEEFVVVDKQEGNHYEGVIFKGSKIFFESPEVFYYTANKNNKYYVIEQTIK